MYIEYASNVIFYKFQKYFFGMMSQKKMNFDKEEAMSASHDIDRIKKLGIFDSGKSGVEIIREWRDKRRF